MKAVNKLKAVREFDSRTVSEYEAVRESNRNKRVINIYELIEVNKVITSVRVDNRSELLAVWELIAASELEAVGELISVHEL